MNNFYCIFWVDYWRPIPIGCRETIWCALLNGKIVNFESNNGLMDFNIIWPFYVKIHMATQYRHLRLIWVGVVIENEAFDIKWLINLCFNWIFQLKLQNLIIYLTWELVSLTILNLSWDDESKIKIWIQCWDSICNPFNRRCLKYIKPPFYNAWMNNYFIRQS